MAETDAPKYRITPAEEPGWYRIVRRDDWKPLDGKYCGQDAARTGIRRLLEAERKQGAGA